MYAHILYSSTQHCEDRSSGTAYRERNKMKSANGTQFDFSHLVADVDLNRRNVAVYSNGYQRALRAESSGKAISVTKYMTKEEYADLRAKWTDDGRLYDNDANVTQRALAYFNI
jgi:mannitol-specific phosphotransferase system IIBC component